MSKVEQLREALGNLMWDAVGGWDLDNWSDERVEKVSGNIVNSLTVKEK
mgnify:CR=1 FL=1